MHVALITPSWPGTHTTNGIATAVSNLVAGLRETGHDVTIITAAQDAPCDDPAILRLGPMRPPTLRERITSRWTPDGGIHPQFADTLAAAVRRAVLDRGAQVLVMEESHGWAGMMQPQLPIPVVLTLHGPHFMLRHSETHAFTPTARQREAREEVAFRTCAGITAPSAFVLDAVRDRYGLPDIPQTVIPNPIPLHDPVNYDTMDARARRSILFVGRIDRLKGADTLLDAFGQLIAEGSDAHLTIAGPDLGIEQPDGSMLHLDDALAGFPDETRARVSYEGSVDKGTLAALRRRHGIAVMTSRIESLSYTLLESMAHGVATISTDVGGPSEVLEDGRTGLLIPAADPQALARAMQRLIDDADLAARLGAAAHDRIAAGYLPARIAEDMVRFLDDVLARWTAP